VISCACSGPGPGPAELTSSHFVVLARSTNGWALDGRASRASEWMDRQPPKTREQMISGKVTELVVILALLPPSRIPLVCRPNMQSVMLIKCFFSSAQKRGRIEAEAYYWLALHLSHIHFSLAPSIGLLSPAWGVLDWATAGHWRRLKTRLNSLIGLPCRNTHHTSRRVWLFGSRRFRCCCLWSSITQIRPMRRHTKEPLVCVVCPTCSRPSTCLHACSMYYCFLMISTPNPPPPPPVVDLSPPPNI